MAENEDGKEVGEGQDGEGASCDTRSLDVPSVKGEVPLKDFESEKFGFMF